MKISKTIEKLIAEYGKGMPKVRVVPIMRTKDEEKKAELLKQIIEHNWSEIGDRFQKEVLRPMTRCYLYGTHRWIGYGQKDRHMCRICGWKTPVMIDPKYWGQIEVKWDKQHESLK